MYLFKLCKYVTFMEFVRIDNRRGLILILKNVLRKLRKN